MKVAVTGVAGFVGLNFTNYALAQGATVVGYDINDAFGRLHHSGVLKNPNFTFMPIDLAAENLELDATVTHAVHFAALAHVDYSRRHPEAVIANNVNSTLSVLRALRITPRPSFFISSVEVYGGAHGHIYKETDPRTPLSAYALSKVCCEDLVGFYREKYRLDLTVARLTNLFGPWQSPDRVIPRSIARRLYGLPLMADESRTRDFLHVREVIRAIWIGLRAGKSFGTLNLSSGVPTSIRDVVQNIASPNSVYIMPDSDPHSRGSDLTSSPALAQASLQWEPQCDFIRDVEEIMQWYATNKTWLAQFERQISGDSIDSFLVDDKRFAKD